MRIVYPAAIFGLLAIPSLVMLWWAWPGFFQADHQMTIALLISGIPSKMHSILWAILALPFLYYTPSYGCYGFIQIACFAIAVSFTICRMVKIKVLTKKRGQFLPESMLSVPLFSFITIFGVRT